MCTQISILCIFWDHLTKTLMDLLIVRTFFLKGFFHDTFQAFHASNELELVQLSIFWIRRSFSDFLSTIVFENFSILMNLAFFWQWIYGWKTFWDFINSQFCTRQKSKLKIPLDFDLTHYIIPFLRQFCVYALGYKLSNPTQLLLDHKVLMVFFGFLDWCT